MSVFFLLLPVGVFVSRGERALFQEKRQNSKTSLIFVFALSTSLFFQSLLRGLQKYFLFALFLIQYPKRAEDPQPDPTSQALTSEFCIYQISFTHPYYSKHPPAAQPNPTVSQWNGRVCRRLRCAPTCKHPVQEHSWSQRCPLSCPTT